MERFLNVWFLVTLFAIVCGNTVELTGEGRIESVQLRIKQVQERIQEECPKLKSSPVTDNRTLREMSGLYQNLIDKLIKCRKDNFPTYMRTTSAPVSAGSELTTPHILTPVQCQIAEDLTEAWRQDHTGSRLRPLNGTKVKDTYDMIRSGRPWFRFSGAAGNRILNKCPPAGSCGSAVPIWSDDDYHLPSKVGVANYIKAYASSTGHCRAASKALNVVRCSERPNDFVYKFEGKANFKYEAFCGMLA